VRGLPTGTVTFLFTDIEGSTRLLHELGDEYADALAEHRRVLRAAFTRQAGVEVDTQGDAFFVAFARARDALAAAREGQDGLSGGPIRVRMGVHTGEPLVTDEGYVGIDVHRGARIAAIGHGGQVLVSQSTRELVDAGALRDLGEHRLKDLTAPERLYQLGNGDFPPLRSLNATNLPVATSPLVGRGHELRELQALLRDSARLVTLTGPGGTGKTRLGLQVAAELIEDFPGGVFFVPLAGVRQPELVPTTIAGTIGVRDLGDLRERRALVVIDNLEHLLEAAPAIASLLSTAPQTKVLATSRAPLRIGGEHEYPIEPLPDEDAIELLTQRARAVRRDFTPDAAAQEICRRLDGLPLALELAASRLRSLGSASLLERLDRRLPLLTGGRRDAPERQRTLRATIEWSYDLLHPDLQRPFARLAAFAGTFSIEAAEAVAGAELDDLDSLVEVSLLKAVGADRFLMLETIRELALERLEASDEANEVRLRQAELCTALAQSANLNQEADGPMQHSLVIPEHDNIRAALEWTISAGHGELGLRLAVALENFWVTTDPDEGTRWLERLLPIGTAAPSTLHALAVRCLANCATMSGEDLAERLYEQSLAEFRVLGDELRAGISLQRLAAQIGRRGDETRARLLLEESLASHRGSGFTKGQAVSLTLLGHLEQRQGAPERALDLFGQGIALARETGFTWWEKNVLLSQAELLCELTRAHDAGRSATQALEVADQIGDRIGTIDALVLLARVAAEQEDRELAGRLWGAIEAEVERSPVAGWQQKRERVAPSILTHPDAQFEGGWSAGRRLSLPEAVACALESSGRER